MNKCKKVMCILVILALIMSAIFACSNKPQTRPSSFTEETITASAKDMFIAAGETEDSALELASSLMAYFKATGLETIEMNESVKAIANRIEKCKKTIVAILKKDLDNISILDALLVCGDISSSIGAPLTSDLFYIVASDVKTDFKLSKTDCKKLGTLFLGLSGEIGEVGFNALKEKNFSSITDKQISTVLSTLSTSLSGLVDINETALSATKAAILKSLENLFTENVSDSDAIQKIKDCFALFDDIATALIANYDAAINFGVALLDCIDLSFIKGIALQARESTMYYGWNNNGTFSEITKAAYDGKEGNFDEFIRQTRIYHGYIIDGQFAPISDNDYKLLDKAYRLLPIYQAYSSLSQSDKANIDALVESIMNIGKNSQLIVSSLLSLPIHAKSTLPTKTYTELLSALSALSQTNLTDNFTESEKTIAKAAVDALDGYLRSFMPFIF